MVSAISLGWFADFGKTLTIISRSSQPVHSEKWQALPVFRVSKILVNLSSFLHDIFAEWEFLLGYKAIVSQTEIWHGCKR